MPAPDAPPAPLVLQVCAVDFTAWHFLRPLMAALASRGVRVAAACGDGPWFERMREAGFEMHRITVARRLMAPVAHARAARELDALLARLRPAVVHTHTPVAGWLGRRAAARARVPHCFHTVHGQVFHEGSNGMARALAVAAERRAAPWCEAQLFVSREDREAALRLGFGAAERLVWVGNGVDLAAVPAPPDPAARLAARRHFGLPAEAWVVGFVGRLVRGKGVGDLIEAAARLAAEERGGPARPPLHVLLVGASLDSDRGAFAAAAAGEAARSGIADRVHFAGYVAPPWPALAACDAFCLPSWREGMPTALLEAMATGLPCVATRIRGCREAIDDGTHGLLVAPRDPAALAGALRRLREDPALAGRLGAAARARVAADFGLDDVLARTLAVYAERAPEVLDPRRAGAAATDLITRSSS